MKNKLQSFHDEFVSDERGGATIFGLFVLLVSLMIMGVALDHTNGWRHKTQMQIATDAAALAAAANLSDTAKATELAIQVARMNLPETESISTSDIMLGHIDPDTLEFVSSAGADGKYSAVQVNAVRNDSRANALPTFLLHFVGKDSLNVATSSVAAAQLSVNGGGFAACEDGVYLSSKTVQTGGSNDMRGAICIHGELGVATGGGDYYGTEVRMSSPDIDDIYIASYAPENLPESRLKVARSMAPVLLPVLETMRSNEISELWKSRAENSEIWFQPPAPWGGVMWYYVGEYELSRADYSGALPSFVFDENGYTTVHLRENHWSVQPGELEEHAIYVSNSGIQFAGGIDAQNVAVITTGNIGVGGGPQLFFDDVFFMGTQVNMAGNIVWGEETSPCGEVDYGVYAFGTESLSLGGWTQGARVSGMVGAAPAFDPGGAMQGTGFYFETDSHLDIGGHTDLDGCGTALNSEYTLVDMAIEDIGATGSYLFR